MGIAQASNSRMIEIHRLTKLWLATIFIFFSNNILAQDFSRQIDDFEQSFLKKDIKYIGKHLSSELQFDTIPTALTIPVLEDIIGQFPKIDKIVIINVDSLKATVQLHFPGAEIIESSISFNKKDKIVKIEFVDNMVQELLADQERTKRSLSGPSLDPMILPYPLKKIEIPSKDGLIITGNLYEIDETAPVILLCHQAGFNKFEYADIAPRLNALGFNCLAIDQRSGGKFSGESNETQNLAKREGIEKLGYLDAQQDIEAAVNFLASKYEKKVIIWGSSYSASLALYIGASSDNVEGIISFSPGNYFGNRREPLEELFSKLNKPFFLTSSRSESNLLELLLGDKILSEKQIHFIPEDFGFHGSRVLWFGQEGAKEYWTALTGFLETMH